MLENSLRTIVVSAALAISFLGCSHSQPTSPSNLPSRGAPSAASAPGATVCSAYTGAARGLCQALFASDCVGQVPTPQRCDRLVDTFFAVTGTTPTFMSRIYVSRSVEECANILFVCQDGYQYFSDDSGCGCERLP